MLAQPIQEKNILQCMVHFLFTVFAYTELYGNNNITEKIATTSNQAMLYAF